MSRARDNADRHTCTECRWFGYRRWSDAPCPWCGAPVRMAWRLTGRPANPAERRRRPVNVSLLASTIAALEAERRRLRLPAIATVAARLLEAWQAGNVSRDGETPAFDANKSGARRVG